MDIQTSTIKKAKRKRSVAIVDYLQLDKTDLKPSVSYWDGIDVILDRWETQRSSILKAITICPKCSVTNFRSIQKNAPSIANATSSPGYLSNFILAQACGRNEIMVVTNPCHSCNKACSNIRSSHVVLLSPDYTRRILDADPIHIQLLSLIDVSLTVTKTTNAIATGTLDRRSLLDNPLLSWSTTEDLKRVEAEISNTKLAEVLGFNLHRNPIVKKYMTNGERPQKKMGLCIVSQGTIADIISSHKENAPFQLMEAADSNCALSLLQTMVEPATRRAYKTTDTHEFVSIQLRQNDRNVVLRSATFTTAGLPTSSSACPDLTVENALFPFLFPFGRGQYKGSEGFSDYIRMRIGTLFSVYSLYKPYLLMMYQLKQAVMIANSCTTNCLQRELDKYKRKNRNATDQEAFKYVLSYQTPASIPGTPSWHRRHLKDLIAMVESWGLPDFFLTFTADEVSSTRWPEIVKIETIAQEFNPNFKWFDCPVECAVLFHTRFQLFMNSQLLIKNGLCGSIQHHVVRYEIQNRGSLHAHVILWLSPKDKERIAFEIAAHIPAEDITNKYTTALRDLVISKQLHRCRPAACRYKKGPTDPCKYGFPFDVQDNPSPVLEARTQRWLYYRPTYEHRNVVPYHPSVLLAWGAHMNIQQVTNSSISHYLLKYAMKTEPLGNLKLNSEDAARLGLHDLDTTKLQLISASILSKPISATEAAMSCLQIPLISRSESVHYVDSSPPIMRQRMISKHQHLIFHPVDIYIARPSCLEYLTFYEYHKQYRTVQRRSPTADKRTIGTNAIGQRIEKIQQIVRFTDFHPGHQTEGFFYNVLLRKINFRSEKELLSPANTISSYYLECQLRQLVTTEEDLEMFILHYTQRNMFTNGKTHQLMNMIIQKVPFIRDSPILTTRNFDIDNHDAIRTKMLQTLAEFNDIDNAALTSEQQTIYNSLISATHGLHVISGTPGSGKSFLIRYLTYKLISKNQVVLMTASTGAAATRLSSVATTVHYQFKIPVNNYQYPLSIAETDERYFALKEANVIIIDEMSMLTKLTFEMVIRQIVNIVGGTLLRPFDKKLVLLFGDLAQLPPCCDHIDDALCQPCHITSSTHWNHAILHHLSFSVRHSQDLPFIQFLKIIRSRKPTEQEITNYLGQCIISEDELHSHLAEDTTIICTHRDDVAKFNTIMLNKLFQNDKILHVPLKTNAENEPRLEQWLHNPKFNEIDSIAIGARAMITENIDLSIGAANGAACTILDIKKTAEGQLKGIKVLIQASGKQITLRRTKNAHKTLNSLWYYKSTFPLVLAYAITGHKSQGATISTNLLLILKDAFVEGLAYVMVSRVTTRSKLRILNTPTPDVFTPMPSCITGILN